MILAFTAYADITIANDPSYIAVGARTLGMGKAFTGVTDDLLAIYINPSGLSSIKDWQATSMASKFINEYDYYNSAVAIPLRKGTLGLGLVSSGVSFYSPTATQEVRDGVRYVPSTTEGSSYSYGNNMMLVSYGLALEDMTPWRWADALSLGATWKLYSASLRGPGISGGDGRGNELDLGAHYVPNPMFKAGLTLQNALPFSSGGKIEWGSGAQDALPAILKTGLSFKILGQDGWRQLGETMLSYNLDYDFYPNDSRLPSLIHTGLEWSPSKYIDLRAGIDQDYVGLEENNGISSVSNMTFGVGLYFYKYRFDYAYHQYQIAANDTHYISLTYGIDRLKDDRRPFANLFPADKTILFTQKVVASGEVIKRDIERVQVNSIEALVSGESFTCPLILPLGKNPLVFSGHDASGNFRDSMKNRVLVLKGFRDVEPGYWAAIPIGILAMEGIIDGYPDGTFKPRGQITRAEFTKLLMAIKNIGDFKPRGKPYKDVRVDHWAANYIGYGAKYGYVKGYPDGAFRPSGPVTRAEGATMIVRFAGLASSMVEPLDFLDVPGRHWAAKDIMAAREHGILSYLKGKHFEPNFELTRAEVAQMLSKTPPMADRVKYILDWERGY